VIADLTQRVLEDRPAERRGCWIVSGFGQALGLLDEVVQNL
jgi:hypothetical protein